MGNPLKNKVGSWALSMVESALFSFFSKIKMNTITFLEDLPNNSSKMIYGICLLLFFVVTAVAGAVILPASLILILVQYAAPTVNKVLLAGQCFACLGAFYLVVSVSVILIVSKSVKSSAEKATRGMIRKLNRR